MMNIRAYQADFPPCPECGRAMSRYSKTCANCATKGRGSLPRRQFTIRVCLGCRAIFYVPSWRVRQNRGVFCSRACKDQYQTTLIGESSFRWKGGADHRRGIGWKVVRERALIRAKGKCEDCSRPLEYHDYGVHHIKPYKRCRDDTEANVLSNVLVLCRSCHAKADRLGCLPQKEVMPR